MTQTTIKQLLDKYWNCETSPEEEQLLTDFFAGDSVPEEWKKYQALFGWKKTQTLVKATPEFKAEIGQPVVIQFYSVIKVAASILLILTIGIGFHTHYKQVQWMDTVFSETYSEPKDSLLDTKNAVEKVSSVLNLTQEQKSDAEKTDSLTNDPVE
ncbi:hypothetical protein AGMMS50239_11170 [Bacteroidia bacterium]|nr:hypothetical protein FACS1894207_1440 [Bacteroidia bacterium]GHT61055.1 hypothetical protein AGMMS50239_11170 [Bacteroidia bacterium]